jgi:phage N-6-adenine-methyltransferase
MLTAHDERIARQEWRTPDDFWRAIHSEFDFQLDAAASPDNARCPKYYTAEQDSLSESCQWITDEVRRVWINPGFNNIGPWCAKAHREVAGKGSGAAVVILSLVSPSTEWWMKWAEKASKIRLIGGRRIQFDPPSREIKRSSNARENCVIVYRGDDQPDRGRPPLIWTWDWSKQGLTKHMRGVELR